MAEVLKGLPTNVDAERFVLGVVLLDNAAYSEVAALPSEAFSLDKHRKIFRRMADLEARSQQIDRVTLANELMKNGELEAIGGITYLVSLDDGMPGGANAAPYIHILREKHALRQLIFTGQHMMNRAMNEDGEAESIIESVEERLLALRDGPAVMDVSTPSQIVEEVGITQFLDPTQETPGISTGFIKFDDLTGGLQDGDLIVIGGRPSHGKTAWALNVAENVTVKQKRPVILFSLEMPKKAVLRRMMYSVARVDSQRVKKGWTSPEEKRRLSVALHKLLEAPLLIDDSTNLGVMDIRAKLQRLKKRSTQPHLVIVDFLQLMSGKGRSENRNQEVSAISRGLKTLAKDLSVPVMALASLSRDPEKRKTDHRPILSDLRESGSIESDADLVGFIHREELYSRDREDLRGLGELIIAKQRNGPIDTVNLVFLHSYTRFENRAEDTPYEP